MNQGPKKITCLEARLVDAHLGVWLLISDMVDLDDAPPTSGTCEGLKFKYTFHRMGHVWFGHWIDDVLLIKHGFVLHVLHEDGIETNLTRLYFTLSLINYLSWRKTIAHQKSIKFQLSQHNHK